MMTAKIFENGRSQAVRLPKKCRFQTDEVNVTKLGDIVMLIPKDSKWQGLLQSLDLPHCFLALLYADTARRTAY